MDSFKTVKIKKRKSKEKKGKKYIDYINQIKNKYILKLIFNNLPIKKRLEIAQYNKNSQNRLNININDYKDYSEIYTSIEIIIIPIKNKSGKIFNFPYGENESFFHVYINNNNKKEIKGNNRNFITKKDKIKTIKIKIDYQVKSLEGLFKGCKCIKSIIFKKFYRNNINNMSYMFYNCYYLKKLNIYNIRTDNVINMCYMFYGCSSLEELNLSKFNTYKAVDMDFMFNGCSSLIKLNISNFDMTKAYGIYNLRRFLFGSSSLKEIKMPRNLSSDLNNWKKYDTQKKNTINKYFFICIILFIISYKILTNYLIEI